MAGLIFVGEAHPPSSGLLRNTGGWERDTWNQSFNAQGEELLSHGKGSQDFVSQKIPPWSKLTPRTAGIKWETQLTTLIYITAWTVSVNNLGFLQLEGENKPNQFPVWKAKSLFGVSGHSASHWVFLCVFIVCTECSCAHSVKGDTKPCKAPVTCLYFTKCKQCWHISKYSLNFYLQKGLWKLR